MRRRKFFHVHGLVGGNREVNPIHGVGRHDIEFAIQVEVSQGDSPRLLAGSKFHTLPEGAISFAEQDSDLVEVGCHRDQVEDSVSVHIAGGDRVGVVERKAVHGGLKAAISFAGEEGDIVGNGIASDDVEIAIAVEVGHDKRSWEGVGREDLRRLEAGLRRWRLVGHHAVVEEDFQLPGVEAGDGDVILAGMARISNGDAVGIGAGRQGLTPGESAAGLTVQHRNRVVSVVGDCEVRNSIAIQIADGDLVGQTADGIALRREEAAAGSIVHQHADSVVAGVGRYQVRKAIIVQVAGGHPVGLLADRIFSRNVQISTAKASEHTS